MDRKKFISVFSMFPFASTKMLTDLPIEQLEPTCDPFVFIEEKRIGYIRYRAVQNGVITKQWEVHGICTGIGKCYEGAVNEKPILDCPVNEFFKSDCCNLKVNVLYKREQ
jgi:hypothetical protein